MASTSGTASSSAPTKMMAPKSRQDAAATAARGSVSSCAASAASTARRERRIVGDQDRLRAGVVLGLRQQVGRDPVGLPGRVGEDQHLGGAGDHVDADASEHQALGRRHIGVAGPHDLGHRPRWSRSHRRAPPPPARRRPGRPRPRRRACAAASTSGLSFPVRRRHHHDDARNARHLGGHRIHQHRRRIGRGAARHIEPDRLDGGPAMAELHPESVGEALVTRQLAAVIGLDALARERERVERRRGRRPHERPRSRRP